MRVYKFILPENISIKKSDIDNSVGLFCTKNIKKGDVVFGYPLYDWTKSSNNKYIEKVYLLIYDKNKNKSLKYLVNRTQHTSSMFSYKLNKIICAFT